MEETFKIIVLISGRGMNLQSLILRAKHYEITAVLTDNPEAPGLKYAQDANIPFYSFSKDDYPAKKEQRKAIFDAVSEISPNLVCLAGFMHIVPSDVVEAWHGRMINIHPSLLPKYPGLNTHAQVLKADDPWHGCTVHYVDSGVDTGPIIAQLGCVHWTPDTEEILAERVLILERKLYPWVVNFIAQGKIWLKENVAQYDADVTNDANKQGIYIFQK